MYDVPHAQYIMLNGQTAIEGVRAKTRQLHFFKLFKKQKKLF